MELFGSNERFGTERVDLSEKRWVLETSGDEKAFPAGVGGLIPVVTLKKKGGEKTCYAFGSDAPVDAVALTNKMLVQAAQLSGYNFGQIGGIQIGIPEQGWGFTRVEMVPLDAHGQPSAAPLHLHIETSDEPGCPDSLSSVVEYDTAGEPRRMVLTEYGESRSCRVLVTPNEKTGKFSVYKVEEFFGRGDSRLLYKRGWQPKEDDGRGDARKGAGPRQGAGSRRDAGPRQGAAPARNGAGDRRGSGPRRWDDDRRSGGRRPGDRGGWDRGGRDGRSRRGDW